MDRISAGQNGDIVVGGVDSVDFTERLNTVFAELQMFRAIGFFNQLTSGVGNFSASSAFSSLSQNIAGFSISLSPGGGSSSLTLNPGRR